MRAVVVAGSNLNGELDRSIVSSADLLVAVDGGADALARIGVRPDVLVGDLDSISRRTRADLQARGVEISILPTAKDVTDTEAALRLVVDRGVDDIVVFGALGGPRLDHLLGNLLLLSSPWLSTVRICLVDANHAAFLAHGEVEFTGECGDTVSLLPLTAMVVGVNTYGLLYPLNGETLLQSATRGVSNALAGAEARVTHGEGVLLIIHYRGR